MVLKSNFAKALDEWMKYCWILIEWEYVEMIEDRKIIPYGISKTIYTIWR